MSNKRTLLTYSSSSDEESTDEEQPTPPSKFKLNSSTSPIKKTKLSSEPKPLPTKIKSITDKPKINSNYKSKPFNSSDEESDDNSKKNKRNITESKKPIKKQPPQIKKLKPQSDTDSDSDTKKQPTLKKKTTTTTTTTSKPNKPLKKEDLSDTDSDSNKKETPKVLTKLAISTTGNQNEKLTDILTQLSLYEKNRGQIHKFNAYKKAVISIKAYPHKIKSGDESKKLDGVGAKIAKKVQEIIDTGKLNKLQVQKEDKYLTSLGDLSRISGIGPQIAKKFIEEGINSVEDLKKVKDKLNHHQQIGLKYLEDFEKRVPRAEIEEMEVIVAKVLKSIDVNIKSEVCGSYRRGLPTSGDIDILITHPNYTLKMKEKKQTFQILEKLVDRLKKDKIIIDDISLGPFKYMGVCLIDMNKNKDENSSKPVPRRVDLKLLPLESYYFGLLHCTGSDEFNRQMRTVALKKGYTLSEYCINKMEKGKKSEEDIIVNSEKEIFDIIGMQFYTPPERNI